MKWDRTSLIPDGINLGGAAESKINSKQYTRNRFDVWQVRHYYGFHREEYKLTMYILYLRAVMYVM